MARQSLDQERAAFAWEETIRIKAGQYKFSDFTNLAKGAPALIMSNGLMPTLAFLQQKNDEARVLQKIISKWIHRRFSNDVLSDDFVGVMEALHGGSSDLYIQATEEALEILRWIRQFAPALGKD